MVWAEGEPSIRVLILEGSRGGEVIPDEYSDYDINVFIRGENRFLQENAWMNEFGSILVYQKDDFDYRGITIDTRLILYKDSPRIDFSFWPENLLVGEMTEKLPESYRNGYRLLVDKDGAGSRLPEPTGDGFGLRKPGSDVFLENIYFFWFEILASLKYLRRGNLWFLKSILDGPVRRSLFRMILWREGCRRGWNRNDLHLGGKNMEDIMDPGIREKIPGCFSDYSIPGIRNGLLHMATLFNQLARELSDGLDYPLPGKKIVGFEEHLIQGIKFM